MEIDRSESDTPIKEENENQKNSACGISYSPISRFQGHENAGTSVKFSPDGNLIATTSDDGTACVWSINGKHVMKIQGHIAGLSDCTWAPDGKSLATASDDKTVRIWDVDTGKQLRVLRGHTYFVTCVQFNYKGNLLASGSADENVKIWDVKQGKCLRTLAAHSDALTSVDFSRDGTILISSSSDGLIRLWDTNSGHCLRTIVVQTKSPVMYAIFSPNCKYILATSLDGSLRLWDYMRDKCVKTYNRHSSEFRFSSPSCFIVNKQKSSNNIYIAQPTNSNAIKVWDVNSKQLVTTFEGHRNVILGMDYDTNSNTLVSSDKDGVFIIWPIKF